MSNDKETILYIGGFELPDKNAAAHRVIGNGKILRDLGYEVIYDGITKEQKSATDLNNPKDHFGFKSYAQKYPSGYLNWLRYITQLKRYKTLIKKHNVKLVIGYNLPAISLFRLFKYCQSKKVKLVADCTEWYTPSVKYSIIKKQIKKLDTYLRMEVMHPKLDGLIVISDYLFNFYKDKVDSLVNIPPLVDLSMEKWKYLKDGVDKEYITLIYAGSLGKRKDRLDKIIQILTEINSNHDLKFKFKIIGLSKLDYIDLFGKESLPSNFDDFATFKGRIPHEAVLKEVSQSHFQIILRDYNLSNSAGFPTKFVESISCGTPVLSNLPSNMDEYFIDGETGFFLDTSNNLTLEESLLKALMSNSETIINMKQFCRSSSIFDYKNFIEPTEDFVDKLLDHKNKEALDI